MSLPRAYRTLLVTYPRAWRHRHGGAMLATLLDAHAAQGQARPSVAERLNFLVSGVIRRTTREGCQVMPPLIAPGHRFDQTNGVIIEREQTAAELMHSRWFDQEPPPTFIPVAMVGGRPNSFAR